LLPVVKHPSLATVRSAYQGTPLGDGAVVVAWTHADHVDSSEPRDINSLPERPRAIVRLCRREKNDSRPRRTSQQHLKVYIETEKQ